MEATDSGPLREQVLATLRPYESIVGAAVNILSFKENGLIPVGILAWVLSFAALIVVSRIDFPVLFLAAVGFGLSRVWVWGAPRIRVPQAWLPRKENSITIDTISQFIVAFVERVQFEYRRLYDMAFGEDASFGSRFGAAVITLGILALLRYVRMPVILAVAMGVVFALPACIENDNLSEATATVGRVVGPRVRAARAQVARVLGRVTRRAGRKARAVASRAELAAAKAEARADAGDGGAKAHADASPTPLSASSPTAGVGSE